MFPVGPTGRRALRRALVESTYPEETIQSYQQSHSLHTMVARALGTTPHYEAKDDEEQNIEPLDTDSVSTFLSHLGVAQHEIHKRIADALRSQLEDEIRKTKDDAPLLNLLKSSWPYATSLSELRPVLVSLLKRLGPRTPLPVLERLAERDEKAGGLKHAEVWDPLPPLLKRLVWEADWDRHIPLDTDSDPDEFLALVNSTLLGEMVGPLIDDYCTQQNLVTAADRAFVGTTRERRVVTSQRRALAAASTAATALSTTAMPLQLSKSSNPSTQSSSSDLSASGKAVTKLRNVLGGESSSASSSYRPKLLYDVLSILIARHGRQEMQVLGGSAQLHCTLVADLLLSAGGPLPKPYQHLLALARILDDSVKVGDFNDSAIARVQACLRNIFQADLQADSVEGLSSPSRMMSAEKAKRAKQEEKEFVKRLLKRIISAGLSAMKEADPQSLFLYPVTDAIAPGYSAVIEKPMCIKTMEQKVEKSEYTTLEEWDRDVQLMYRNCIAYNTGNSGQWFRGEARRQGKTFKDDVLSQAKKLFKAEMAKRPKPVDESSLKRKAAVLDAKGNNETELSSSDVEPLAPSKSKKRKKDNQENIPSIPALASMILADPFVVRLLLDRVLRLLRINVLRGTSLPAAHRIVPSIMQLLHIVQWSAQCCAIRGKRYFVPDAGLIPFKEKDEQKDGAGAVPFTTLRLCTPFVMQLLLESELDRRTAVGGDLNLAAQALPDRPALQSSESFSDSSQLHVIRALVEGALVHVCRPGNSHETSLASTFPKFAAVLQDLSMNLYDEKPFFVSLIEALLRHKSKLARTTRDEVVTSWIKWFQVRGTGEKGAMSSALHECLIMLLNEWAALGNLLLPRDMLLKYSEDAVAAADATEQSPERRFAAMWKNSDDMPEFAPVKAQYQRMLQSIPEANSIEWKGRMGIADLEVRAENSPAAVDESNAVQASSDEVNVASAS